MFLSRQKESTDIENVLKEVQKQLDESQKIIENSLEELGLNRNMLEPFFRSASNNLSPEELLFVDDAKKQITTLEKDLFSSQAVDASKKKDTLGSILPHWQRVR